MKNDDDLLGRIEKSLEREGLLPKEVPEEQECQDPPRRTVVLGSGHHAAFEGDPINELWVFKESASEPLKLPYFNPEGRTDKDLARRIRVLEKFA